MRAVVVVGSAGCSAVVVTAATRVAVHSEAGMVVSEVVLAGAVGRSAAVMATAAGLEVASAVAGWAVAAAQTKSVCRGRVGRRRATPSARHAPSATPSCCQPKIVLARWCRSARARHSLSPTSVLVAVDEAEAEADANGRDTGRRSRDRDPATHNHVTNEIRHGALVVSNLDGYLGRVASKATTRDAKRHAARDWHIGGDDALHASHELKIELHARCRVIRPLQRSSASIPAVLLVLAHADVPEAGCSATWRRRVDPACKLTVVHGAEHVAHVIVKAKLRATGTQCDAAIMGEAARGRVNPWCHMQQRLCEEAVRDEGALMLLYGACATS